MSLPSGTKLGPYEITDKLGAGGMGEIYRARDLRLERNVAVKVLPTHLASDPAALARFEREAKAVAALSHPNILGIFDVGNEGSIAYIVMELLEGATLRDRVAMGAVAVRKVIEYGVQVADGLAAAHERGVIHRDLKPDNLFLTAEGRVKILDFGLAKEIPVSTQAGEATTMGVGTAPGIIMGTVGYMAPEQVRGQAADARTDLFALGIVLYELITGRLPFAKETSAETMAAILREDPPELATVDAKIPVGLARLVQHCLEKNPAERFQSARDLAFSLRALAPGTPSSGTNAPVTVATHPSKMSIGWRRLTWGAAAASLLILGIIAGLRWSPIPSAPGEAVILDMEMPAGVEMSDYPSGAFSKNGRLMLYGESGVDLQVGSVDDETRKATTIANSGFPDQARFSPDGRWIAFNAFESGTVAGTEQCQVFVSAYPPRGAPQRITDHGGVQPIWRADGRELYYLDPAGNLIAIPVVQTEPNFRVGAPQLLFKTGLKKVSREVEDYAVADHGKLFLLKLPADGERQAGFTIVLNWRALHTGAK